jgi:hypothetical protein
MRDTRGRRKRAKSSPNAKRPALRAGRFDFHDVGSAYLMPSSFCALPWQIFSMSALL